MNAHEANSKAHKYLEMGLSNTLREIMDKIRDAAAHGEFMTQFTIQEKHEKHITRLLKFLVEEEKYKIERKVGYDQQERRSWDYLIIDWS